MTDAAEEEPRPGTRAHRVWVQDHTLAMLHSHGTTLVPDKTMLQPYTLVARKQYRVVPAPPPPGPCPSVRVVEKDTLYVAADMLKARPSARVAVLDMASERNPGGGYLTGAGSQEEDLCRRSTLVPYLCYAQTAGLYPIPHDGLVVVPTVRVLKSARPDYRVLKPENRFDVGVIVAPALRRPSLTRDGGYAADDRARMAARIRLLLSAAHASGFDALVLGAWGCGAFGNPPHDVAQVFREALAAHGAAFRDVAFAIVGDGNAAVFARVFPMDAARK